MKTSTRFRSPGLLPLLLLALPAPLYLTAESKEVVFGPDNTDPPAVKFFSKQAGSIHTLEVKVVSGWKFVQGPSLAVNPFGLWTKTGSTTFSMTNIGMDIGDLYDGAGADEIKAEVVGEIRKTGGGGGGGSSSSTPVAVDVLTRYFSMTFHKPLSSAAFYVHEEEEDVPVKVVLANASGEPAFATVDFTFQGNAAALQESTTYNNGVAENLYTVTGDAGDTFTITADAEDVDITEGKTASGENTTESLTIFKVEMIDVDASDSDSYYIKETDSIDNIATVKGSGDIILEASILPDTPDIRNIINWQNANEDTENPLKASMSRDESAKHSVHVTTNSVSRRQADVWIVWVNLTDFNNTGPTPSDSSVSSPITYGASSGTRNAVIMQFTISPTGFGSIGDDVEYDIKRTKEVGTWEKNSSSVWEQDSHVGPGADDDDTNTDEDLTPSGNDRIYSVDAPGFIFTSTYGDEEAVYKGSFVEFVNVKLKSSGWLKASDNHAWHSITWLEDDGSGEWQRKTSEPNQIETGSITVGTSSTP